MSKKKDLRSFTFKRYFVGMATREDIGVVTGGGGGEGGFSCFMYNYLLSSESEINKTHMAKVVVD